MAWVLFGTTEVTEDTEKEWIHHWEPSTDLREAPGLFRRVSSVLSPWSQCSPWFRTVFSYLPRGNAAADAVPSTSSEPALSTAERGKL
jgi:hypothetical protein